MARDKGTLEDSTPTPSPLMLLNPLLLFVLFVSVVLLELLNPLLLLLPDGDRSDLVLIICRIPMSKSRNPKQIEPSSRRKRSRNGFRVASADSGSVAVAVAVAASSDIVPIKAFCKL
jgi:hypothetical protein